MSSSVEKIKERLSITDVVSAYVKLEKAGASYKAKCPFHNEKSASFFISPDRGTYYCFGCGAKGDIFTFVEEFEGLEFKQALVNLAEKAGVELVPEARGEQDAKAKLYNAVEAATQYFEKEIQGNKPILEYLQKRGLTAETIAKWRIGWAKNEWRSLHDHLKNQKISDNDMLATGLIKQNDSGSAAGAEARFYDVFRGRIMFPIFDSSGRPVAFSGRIFIDDEKSPKYLNSPATALFNKSEVLYGFDRAKTAIRKLNYSILVEGQMDLILSHQAGLENTVASSGTALTEFHLRRLQKISPRVMFAFDSDSAGFNATKRSAELALQIGMEVKVAVLPPGEDPASLVAKNPNHWKTALKDGKHIIAFYLDKVMHQNTDRRFLLNEIKTGVFPFILELPSKIDQDTFVKMIVDKTGLKEQAVRDDLRTLQIAQAKGIKPVAASQQQAQPSNAAIPISRQQGIERRIIGVILWQESKKDRSEMASAIRKRFVEIAGEESAKKLEEAIETEKEKLIFEAEQYYEHSLKFEEDIQEIFINLQEELLKYELGKKMAELQKAERSQDVEGATKLLAECQGITKKMADLRKQEK